MIRVLAVLLLLASPGAAQIVTEAPDEARIRALAKTLRCPVCQSESILESRSPTAQEMLTLIREMVADDRSDAEITDFFRTRYGEFVMLSPPADGAGRIIWALPLVLLAAGGGVLAIALRRREIPVPATESSARLDADRLREMEL